MTFRATLSGIAPPTTTGSPARGKAVIKVDTSSKKVSVDLDITGITIDQLADGLVAKPIGPIHFHVYRTADDVELILPLPYGSNYRATKTGFHVTMRGYDYEAGAKLINRARRSTSSSTRCAGSGSCSTSTPTSSPTARSAAR